VDFMAQWYIILPKNSELSSSSWKGKGSMSKLMYL